MADCAVGAGLRGEAYSALGTGLVAIAAGAVNDEDVRVNRGEGGRCPSASTGPLAACSTGTMTGGATGPVAGSSTGTMTGSATGPVASSATGPAATGASRSRRFRYTVVPSRSNCSAAALSAGASAVPADTSGGATSAVPSGDASTSGSTARSPSPSRSGRPRRVHHGAIVIDIDD